MYNQPIIIGCDHAAFAAKQELMAYLQSKGIAVTDAGCFSEASVHYPEFAHKVARAVQSGEFERGLLLCGTGIGMSLAANRFKGVRATLVHDEFTATACREHNDSNILVMGARVLDMDTMKHLTDIWLTTAFAAGRHATRVAMIDEI